MGSSRVKSVFFCKLVSPMSSNSIILGRCISCVLASFCFVSIDISLRNSDGVSLQTDHVWGSNKKFQSLTWFTNLFGLFDLTNEFWVFGRANTALVWDMRKWLEGSCSPFDLPGHLFFPINISTLNSVFIISTLCVFKFQQKRYERVLLFSRFVSIGNAEKTIKQNAWAEN